MDDNGKDGKNQSFGSGSQPIFESVPDDIPQTIQTEEAAPDLSAPDALSGGMPPDLMGDYPPVYEESKSKYIVIILAVIFFVVVVIIVFRLLAGGGGNKQPEPEQDITLEYWGLWEDKSVYDPLIQAYQAQHPKVHIKYTKMAPEDYRDKLLARANNGQGPDIFRFHNTWLPEIKSIAAYLPEQKMSVAEFDKTFYPVHKADLFFNNKYYGIPLSIDGLVLIYNDTLLKQAGYTGPPSEWVSESSNGNDMFTVANKLTVRDSSGSIVTAGFAAGTTSNVEHFSEIYGIILLLNGGDLKKLDQKAAQDALQIYRLFEEKHYWSETMDNSISAFVKGKVAMIVAPSWQVLNIKTQNPDLNVKVAPIPKGLGGNSLSIANYWVEGVSVKNKNQLAAWDFLIYLSKKENMVKRYELQSKIRLFGEPYSRVDLADKLITHEYLGPVIKQGKDFKSLPLVTRTFDKGLNDEIVQYLRNAINGTMQGKDYASALKEAKQGLDQVFQKYEIK